MRLPVFQVFIGRRPSRYPARTLAVTTGDPTLTEFSDGRLHSQPDRWTGRDPFHFCGSARTGYLHKYIISGAASARSNPSRFGSSPSFRRAPSVADGRTSPFFSLNFSSLRIFSLLFIILDLIRIPHYLYRFVGL